MELQYTDKHRCLLSFDIVVKVSNTEDGEESCADTGHELRHKDVDHWTCWEECQ